MFLYRFFIRTTDSKPIRERAATTGRRDRGDWVIEGREAGTIVGWRVIMGSVAVAAAL